MDELCSAGYCFFSVRQSMHWPIRLRALGFPSADQFTATERELFALASWLEDTHIRQLPPEERGGLRQGSHVALEAYTSELVAPGWVASALQGRDYAAVCSWLVCLALQYAHEEQCGASEAGATIDESDSQLAGLAGALGVEVAGGAAATLRRAADAARARPSTATAEPAPERDTAGRSGALRALPLGFTTGDALLDDAARVLRLLYVADLQRLQEGATRVVERLQESSANPRTEQRLGRVGR